MYDCFHFVVYIFAFSQLLKLFSRGLDAYPCLGKMSYFSHNGFLLLSGNTPSKKKKNHLQSSAGYRAGCLCGCTNTQPINCLSVGCIWMWRFFSTPQCVSAPFSLTPGISFCADTYPRSNLHETILLRQAFCALLNDGCLRDMVIMIDSEP